MAYKSPLQLSKKLTGIPSRRDSFINRGFNDQNIKGYGKETGINYSDDELKELMGYTFDSYDFDDPEDKRSEDEIYNNFYNKVLDRWGGLQYERASRNLPWKYPSNWDSLSTEGKEEELRNYTDTLNSLASSDYKLLNIVPSVKQRIAQEYQQKYGRPYTGSSEDIWRERAIRFAEAHPDNAYAQNIGQIARDVNGVDHSDLIKDIIDAFHFNRYDRW